LKTNCNVLLFLSVGLLKVQDAAIAICFSLFAGVKSLHFNQAAEFVHHVTKPDCDCHNLTSV
jgi:hypothetical protein|tara:strand:- start:621 stop:806 length:186 start_codon:yes stop_codon:yes gene_type:complete